MILRDYQQRALANVAAEEQRDARVVALVAPTGAGKTAMGVEWAARRAGRGVWIAHRRELMGQARVALTASDVIADVVSVQSIDTNLSLPPAPWYVFDELHHYFGPPRWSQAIASARQGPALGLTATPERADGVALGNLADAIVVAAQPKELVAAGHLVACEVIAGPEQTKTLTENPVQAWFKYGGKRRAIVFCRDVDHARKVAQDFVESGVAAACVDGRDEEARVRAIEAHRAGKLQVLTSVQILTEGYDDPSIEVAIMARGFSSDGAWIQACGRVVRPFPGKKKATIIDLRGSVYLWGLPQDDRIYSLEGRAMRVKEGDGEAIRQCKVCQHIFRAVEYRDATCPGCGARAPGKPDPAVRRAQLAAVAATHTQETKRSVFRQLQQTARMKGFKPAWAAIQFKVRYGHWPRTADR